MRLLDTKNIELHEFHGESVPSYAILSHTWGDEEVSYQLFPKPEGKSLAGYKKITACCKLAAAQGWHYVWIDTCCIDKTSSAELSEAINSMWKWYEDSGLCLAYLVDCLGHEDDASDSTVVFRQVRNSKWFTRGWTLQELLAPTNVVFYDSWWREIGDKHELSDQICAAAKIGRYNLRHPRQASIAAKMSWMSSRRTTRPEDMAYSLLGLFSVYMPLIYGEGSNAFLRLQQEIVKISNDESIFAWTDDSLAESGMFALSPAAFVNSGNVVVYQHPDIRRTPYSVTNFGLAIETDSNVHDRIVHGDTNKPYPWKLPLACQRVSEHQPLTISLLSVTGNTVRVNVGTIGTLQGAITPRSDVRMIYVKSSYRPKASGWCEPLLKLRWNQTFKEHMSYAGTPHGGHISERLVPMGVDYSNYTGMTVTRRFIRAKGEFPQLGQLHGADWMEPKLNLQWRLERGAVSLSSTICVRKGGRSVGQVYDLGLGGEITIPLWDDLHLRADLSKEPFGDGAYLIALELIISTRKKIFPTLR